MNVLLRCRKWHHLMFPKDYPWQFLTVKTYFASPISSKIKLILFLFLQFPLQTTIYLGEGIFCTVWTIYLASRKFFEYKLAYKRKGETIRMVQDGDLMMIITCIYNDYRSSHLQTKIPLHWTEIWSFSAYMRKSYVVGKGIFHKKIHCCKCKENKKTQNTQNFNLICLNCRQIPSV